MKQPSKVLLIGGGGYVGRKLAGALVGQKIKVVSLGRSKCPVAGVENFLGDAADAKMVKRALEGVGVVVYLVTENKSKKYEDHYRANIEGLKLALSEARKMRVGKFVYVSTTMVFEKSNEVVDENNYRLRSGKSGNYYVDTKTEAVKIVKKTKGVGMVVVYPGLVVNRDFRYREPKTAVDKIKEGLGLLTQGGVMMMGGDQSRRVAWVEIDQLISMLVTIVKNPKTEGEYIAVGVNGTPASYRKMAGDGVKFFPIRIPSWVFKYLIGVSQYDLLMEGNHYSSERFKKL